MCYILRSLAMSWNDSIYISENMSLTNAAVGIIGCDRWQGNSEQVFGRIYAQRGSICVCWESAPLSIYLHCNKKCGGCALMTAFQSNFFQLNKCDLCSCCRSNSKCWSLISSDVINDVNVTLSSIGTPTGGDFLLLLFGGKGHMAIIL